MYDNSFSFFFIFFLSADKHEFKLQGVCLSVFF